jgi:hypothetical protein
MNLGGQLVPDAFVFLVNIPVVLLKFVRDINRDLTNCLPKCRFRIFCVCTCIPPFSGYLWSQEGSCDLISSNSTFLLLLCFYSPLPLIEEYVIYFRTICCGHLLIVSTRKSGNIWIERNTGKNKFMPLHIYIYFLHSVEQKRTYIHKL